MAKFTIEIDYDEFTAPIVNSKRSTLGKRGITGGVLTKFSKIPSNVLTGLLIDAVRDYMQVGLKTLDQSTATVEDCQKAMRARLELLESGAVSGPGATRKAPTRDPIKAAAKMIVKKAISDRSEEKLDGKVLTKMVSDLFKAHDAWVKAGSKEDDKLVKAGKLVANALKTARAQQEAANEMSESLAGLAKKASDLTAKAREAKEAAAEAGDDAEVETAPAPKAKSKGKGQGRSA